MKHPQSKRPLCFGGQAGSLNEVNLLGSFVLGTYILAGFVKVHPVNIIGVIND